MEDNILVVNNLKKYFDVPAGLLHAVDDVSFTVKRGMTLGLVGESGCGKSTIGRLLVGLLKPTSGEILFEGKDVGKMDKNQLRDLHDDVQLIFQDPYSSLNPRMSVSQTIGEPMAIRRLYKSRKALEERVRALMDTVGLSSRLYDAYPHELDGGRRQRVGIARALALNPKFIVCDEPVSSLDVSIQAQVLNLLKDLQDEFQLSYVFITHDLSVVRYFSDNIAVMYLGKLVETAPTQELFRSTKHPYSIALLSAIPIPDAHRKMERVKLHGELSSPINPEPVCRFASRCLYATEECVNADPELLEYAPKHYCACFHTDNLDEIAERCRVEDIKEEK